MYACTYVYMYGYIQIRLAASSRLQDAEVWSTTTQLARSFVAPSVRQKFTCKASWRCFLLIESRR